MSQQSLDFISLEEKEVKLEKTCWRDLDLLKRHRVWGWDCPAQDIDFLEYDKRKASVFSLIPPFHIDNAFRPLL